MSTRQRRNPRLRKTLFPAACALLCCYFLHHATIGKYGLESQGEMADKAIHLQYKLAGLRETREELASRVRLLKDGNIERDMLDEQARYQLNMVHRDEVVIMRGTN